MMMQLSFLAEATRTWSSASSHWAQTAGLSSSASEEGGHSARRGNREMSADCCPLSSSRSVTDSQQNCGLPLMTRLTQQESRIQKFIYNTLSFFVLKKS